MFVWSLGVTSQFPVVHPGLFHTTCPVARSRMATAGVKSGGSQHAVLSALHLPS